jgi:hypothetical protein
MQQFQFFEHPLWRTASLRQSQLADLAMDVSGLDADVEKAEIQEVYAQLTAALDQTFQRLPEGALRTQVYNARKRWHQQQTMSAAFEELVEKEPDLSAVKEVLAQFRLVQNADNQRLVALKAAYDDAIHKAEAALMRLAQTEELQRPLLFASHDLLEAIPRLLNTPRADWNKSHRHTLWSVLQYAIRMATRTTPLSRFAFVGERAQTQSDSFWGFDMGEDLQTEEFRRVVGVEATNPFQRNKNDTSEAAIQAKVVPNVAILEAMYAVLVTRPAVRNGLQIRLNPSVTAADANPIRWWYYDGQQSATQSSPNQPGLRLVIGFLLENEHVCDWKALSATLTEATDDAAAAERYLLELVDYGLLEWCWPEAGLSASWAGRLYQWLGFLPEGSLDECVTDAAFLLQWLRTAARTLPHQSVMEAVQTQRDAAEQVRLFTLKWSDLALPLRPEQVFYEDASRSVLSDLDNATLRVMSERIGATWRHQSPPSESSQLQQFRAEVANGASPQLIEFQRFIHTTSERVSAASKQTDNFPITALVQPWLDAATGEWRAVLNQFAVGGGRLYSRWSHLLSKELLQDLRQWQTRWPSLTPLTWQGWFNANFQELPPVPLIALPGDRTGAQKSWPISEVQFTVNPTTNVLEMRHPSSEVPLWFFDLGLEAATTRPPELQLLWQAGAPSVSKYDFQRNDWQIIEVGISHRPRFEQDMMVYSRAAWRLEKNALDELLSQRGFDFFRAIRLKIKALSMPRHLFYKIGNTTGQWLDMDSPILVALLEKTLRATSTPVTLYIEEMLPAPDQIPDGYATEVVIEFGWG